MLTNVLINNQKTNNYDGVRSILCCTVDPANKEREDWS